MIEGSDDEPCVSILVIGQEAENQNEFFTYYKEADNQLCLGSPSEWVANEIIWHITSKSVTKVKSDSTILCWGIVQCTLVHKTLWKWYTDT